MARKLSAQFDNFTRFVENVERVISSIDHLKIPTTFEVEEDGKWKNGIEMLGDEKMQLFMTDFMNKTFIPRVLGPAFYEGVGAGGSGAQDVSAHAPIIEKGTSKFRYFKNKGSVDVAYENEFGNQDFKLEHLEQAAQERMEGASLTRGLTDRWRQGFKLLFQNLTKVVISDGGRTVGLGPRDLMLSQKLNQYNMLRGETNDSRYGDFFYAAEFGTGVADNVGGDQWVNRDPQTKLKSGKWWFTDARGRGALFRGQGGLHFLFDAESRMPRKFYYDRMGEMLPEAFTSYLEIVFGENIRRVN